jgi:hypothetical protein
MKRIALVCMVVALGVLTGSCGGNSTLDDSEAAVVLRVEIEEYNPEIDICLFGGFDVAISEMTVSSEPKSPTAELSTNQDVNIRRWVITPYRTDGGSTASPEWIHDMAVFVPSEGETKLENYRVYPAENFLEVPLSYLLPENGGSDPETGQSNIRQSLQLQMFGTTVSGKSVATEPIPIAFNFFCVSP